MYASVEGSAVDQAAPGHSPPPAPPAPRKFRLTPWIIAAVLLFGIGSIALAGAIFSGINGKGPFAMLAASSATNPVEIVVVDRATDTPIPSATQAEIEIPTEGVKPSLIPTLLTATSTEIPVTPTLEPTPIPEILSLGAADKIAFLNENDLWVMNVDGSDLIQLTNDGAEKTSLDWFPDGSAVTYISGKCIFYIEIETTRSDLIACFESTEYLETFRFSPEGSQVAISVNRELYVIPWDLTRLQSVRSNRDLQEMSDCPSLAPFRSVSSTEPIKKMRWSNDGKRIIIIKLANIQGKLGDLIQIYDFTSCEATPNRIDEIPASRFTIEGYDKVLRIENFGFDGDTLLALVSYTRNGGYGHLYIYNTFLRRADLKVNPINGECCYRDPQFSPDGRYLIFAYQPFEQDARSQLFYIPYGTIGTGASYQPLPVPDDFFTDPRTEPQPILRPAQ
jgi:dipeptidyl aminopeptidase/acylaminoacyl peptidase